MFCKRCRYNLAHLATDQCPECGRKFEPGNQKTYRKRPGLPRWVRHLGKLTLVFFILVSIVAGIVEWQYQLDRVPADILLKQGHSIHWTDEPSWIAGFKPINRRFRRVEGVSTVGVVNESTILTIARFGDLVNLIINSTEQSSLPTNLGTLNALKDFRIFKSSITALPSEIGRLENLDHLSVEESQLTTVPPEIGDLTELRIINLGENAITSLPPEIGGLRNLKSMFLTGNQLSDLPEQFGQLQNLVLIEAIDNQFTSIPPSIFDLTNLQALYLWNNRITEVSPDIGRLKKLNHLSLSSNRLKTLPESMGLLQSLEKLDLSNNRLVDQSLDCLIPLQQLQHLNVSGTNVTQSGIASLKRSMPNCKIYSDVEPPHNWHRAISEGCD